MIDVKPDILCLGNTLGFMGAVLTSRDAFKAFTGVAEIALYVNQSYAVSSQSFIPECARPEFDFNTIARETPSLVKWP